MNLSKTYNELTKLLLFAASAAHTRVTPKILLLSSKRQTFNVARIKLLKDIIIIPGLATLLLIGTLFKFLLAIISELDLQMLNIWFLCKIYFFIK